MSATYEVRHVFCFCPWCQEKSGQRVDHLFASAPTPFGPWYCDVCGRGFTGNVDELRNVTLHKNDRDQYVRTFVLLRRADTNLFLVLDAKRHVDKDDDGHGHLQYLYEEHSCPTNWLRECVAVIDNGDADPHGFLSVIRSIDAEKNVDTDKVDWEVVFPEAFPK